MLSLQQAILKNGITSKSNTTTYKKGAVFVVHSKDDFASMRGRIVTSTEQLTTVQGTHWTPNVFRQFRYTDEKRTKISGFEERNLKQINMFMIDIDTKAHSLNDILLACVDDSVGPPSLVMESDNGYQVGFNLSEPIYLSNIRKGISFTVAKRIAHNLKRSLAGIDADLFCNDFGFFRMPNEANIVWNQIDTTYTPAQMIQWSQQFDNGQPLYVRNTSNNTQLTQSEWFKALTLANNIRGCKGQLGRNNLLFTIALTCFADGFTDEQATEVVFEVNRQFTAPLKDGEVCTILASAYSGKYKGPSAEYIEALLSLCGITMNVRLNYGWYKQKKERSERVRVHLHEWEQDIEKFLASHPEGVSLSQSELCEVVGIPRASLNKLIAQSRKLVKRVSGTGRNAKTIWITLAQLAQSIINTIKAKKMQYAAMYRMINNALITTFGYEVVNRLIELNTINIFDENKLSTVP